ncbi:MAG: DUF302 domain-containing protein [Hyphomicrobium sp.]|uniref:DUF302 domain-containing protein n=1 Tax=Hyphomicrobium sp. TaxID=82 RepID=UPI0039E43545
MMVEGLITLPSSHPAKETADRLAAAVAGHGMTLMARVDHAAAAAKVGLELRPTEVLFFGNPSTGTLLMQDNQAIGLELPLKVLVWQDETAKTWISYPRIDWLASRYALTLVAQTTVGKIASLLKTITEEAAQ